MKKKLALFTFVIIISNCLLFSLKGKQSVESYLLENHKSATEILCHEEVSENYDIIFFLDENAKVSCAILKKGWSGYQILRTSGRLEPSNTRYLCSHFRDGKENFWIDWGILTDDGVRSVWAGSEQMNIVECSPYSYRICWLIGSGQEPQSHAIITNKETEGISNPSVSLSVSKECW